jgi:hypothetical protein
MTSEELELALTEVNDKLVELSKHEAKLTNKEWRLQQSLIKEKNLLEKIQKARESQDTRREAYLTAQYNFLKDSRTRHPIINYLMQLKMRSQIWD